MHIASCIGNIVSRFFSKYETNEGMRNLLSYEQSLNPEAREAEGDSQCCMRCGGSCGLWRSYRRCLVQLGRGFLLLSCEGYVEKVRINALYTALQHRNMGSLVSSAPWSPP